MDPLSVIASTIAVVQAVAAISQGIQHVRGLPKAFNEVHQNLPLVQDTLGLAKQQLQSSTLSDSSRSAIEPAVRSCQGKAIALRDIFQKVDAAKKDTKLDVYRITVLRLGKAHRVETLMQDILKNLKVLAINEVFRAATQSPMAQLEEAIKKLSAVEPSIPDSDFKSSETQITQNVAQGGEGKQIVNTGGHMENVFGNQFNSGGGAMNFVSSKEDHEERRRAILKTLYTSPYRDRKDRNPDRIPGTCEWFVEHGHFRQWRDSKSSSLLWASADPGCGKSVLAKHLVDTELLTTKDRTTCYFFFKDDFEDQRSAKAALSCILHQLLTQQPSLFSKKLVERFEVGGGHLAGSFTDLWDILIVAAQDEAAGEIVCLLDAFDECEEQGRTELARALCKFYSTDNACHLKFLLTSRPYFEIRQGFQPLDIPGLPVIHLSGESEAEMEKIAQEIDLFIRTRIQSIGKVRRLSPGEIQLLCQELLRVPNRTYLWAHLTLDLIQSDIDIDKVKIRETTSRLPDTVDEAYDRILAKSRDMDKAKRLLHIVVAASRPLTLSEMGLAMALREEHRSYKDLELKSEERFREYIRDLCGLFVTVIGSKVYLLHQTAKEFLVQDGPIDVPVCRSNGLTWKSSLRTRESHLVLSQLCIWHLLFEEFETSPLDEDGNLSQYLQDHNFLDYSAKNWALHFRLSDMRDDEAVSSVLKICDTTTKRFLTWLRVYWESAHNGMVPDFTTLMVASYFGLEPVVKLLLTKRGLDLDASDGTHGRSALSWASENGFDSVVKLLIKGPKILLRNPAKFWRGAKVDARDGYGRTPLSYAAWNGHASTAKLLLKAGAHADSKDDIGGTPISYALCTGHDAVARQLMKGAQVASVQKISQQLLLSAAIGGHETIVERLLDNGAGTEVADEYGYTLLHLAALWQHKAVVQLLLNKGAATEAMDMYSRTPLWYAVMHMNDTIVSLLLDSGAAIEAMDENGLTPLSRATKSRCGELVRLLLNRGAAIEAMDKNGKTPLFFAAEDGHEGIVKLLLDRGAATEATNKSGWTPLARAASIGHKGVVKLLLDRGAATEATDKSGWTPLFWAVMKGHEGIVKLLLDRGAATEATDKGGLTPLFWAVIKGHEGIAQLLLDRGAAIEATDKDGWTPLFWAVIKGYEEIAQLLLDRGAAIETMDKNGQTPLLCAARWGHEGIAQLLLNRGAAIEATDKGGLTPLFWAVMNGHTGTVKLLLVWGADANVAELLLAAEEGNHHEVVRLLKNEFANIRSPL